MRFAQQTLAIQIVSIMSLLTSYLLPMSAVCENLPAKFSLVSHTTQIKDGDWCLIAGETGIGGQMKFFLMSNCYPSDKESIGKMKGYTHTEGKESSFICSKPAVVWKVERNKDGTCSFLSIDSNNYLSWKSADKLGVKLSSHKENSSWHVTERVDGKFDVKASPDSRRGLEVNEYGGNAFGVFDNYASSCGVYIYVAERGGSDEQEESTYPSDGDSIAIVCGTEAFVDGVRNSGDVSEYLLNDGTITSDAVVSIWQCEWQSTSTPDMGPYFTLRKGSTFLSADLSVADSPTLWCVKEGCIATCTYNGQWVGIYWSENRKTWYASPMSEARNNSDYSAATFSKIAQSPTSILDSKGLLRLSGGWSAKKLADLQWNSVLALDLTEISFPQHLLSFNHEVETQNMPIFVPQGVVNAIPSEWRFVVACTPTSNRLLNAVQLKDSQPYFSDRQIEMEPVQITYVRHALKSAYWQTICLPFAVSNVPSDVKILRMRELRKDVLELEECKSLNEGEAYLIKLNESLGKEADITFVNSGTKLIGTPLTGKALLGTFLPVATLEDNSGIYTLKAETSTFFPTIKGCRLNPFRAYLRGCEKASLPLSIKIETLDK